MTVRSISSNPDRLRGTLSPSNVAISLDRAKTTITRDWSVNAAYYRVDYRLGSTLASNVARKSRPRFLAPSRARNLQPLIRFSHDPRVSSLARVSFVPSPPPYLQPRVTRKKEREREKSCFLSARRATAPRRP